MSHISVNYDFEIKTCQSCAYNLSFRPFNRRKVFKFGQNASEIIFYLTSILFDYTIIKDNGFSS